MKKIMICLFLACSSMLFSQYYGQNYRQTPGMIQDIPIEVQVIISKDVGVPNNLYNDDLYALVTIKYRNTPIQDAKVLVGSAGLTYSEFNERYEGRIWDGDIGQAIEIAIKFRSGEVIRGKVTKDYAVQIQTPGKDSRFAAGFPIKVGWNFSGTGAPGELNVFEGEGYKHIYQFKKIRKQESTIPGKILKAGNSYLIQIRGKKTIGEFTKNDIELAGNSMIQYSNSHTVTIAIDQKASKTEK